MTFKFLTMIVGAERSVPNAVDSADSRGQVGMNMLLLFTLGVCKQFADAGREFRPARICRAAHGLHHRWRDHEISAYFLSLSQCFAIPGMNSEKNKATVISLWVWKMDRAGLHTMKEGYVRKQRGEDQTHKVRLHHQTPPPWFTSVAIPSPTPSDPSMSGRDWARKKKCFTRYVSSIGASARSAGVEDMRTQAHQEDLQGMRGIADMRA